MTPQEWKEQQYNQLKEKYERERREQYETDLQRWEEFRESKYRELKEYEETRRKEALAAGRKPPPSNIDAKLDAQLKPRPKLEDYPLPEITEDEYEMYFNKPEQLLEIFSGMAVAIFFIRVISLILFIRPLVESRLQAWKKKICFSFKTIRKSSSNWTN